ncbi:MAG: Na(+)/H(+) antiporter subunit B [Spirochaetales bacterium]|nr:Na(+)/H(+) antiporter subunit B [Spirochaetales bacterium]
MVKKVFILLMIILTGLILWSFVPGYESRTALPEVSAHYVEKGPEELGAANIVTAVVVTYRGLDTLGEVTILFAASAVVGLLIHLNKNENKRRREGSEILRTGTALLFPLILLFGIYVFINGHLTPGGGFQGGAIIASAVVLQVLAYPNRKIGHGLLSVIESLSGFTYVLLGAAGVFLTVNGFLDNRILPLGEYGSLLSAGLIPVIYTLVGLKVGSELSSVVISLNGESEEEQL